jgi:2,4-dienoyl-CoA reductase-like NADH-dependent reductase (Old Yellow Enzyme family)
MYEHLANFFGGPPNKLHLALYSIWSRYEWGMVITGNVQVAQTHLTLGRDVVVPRHLDDASVKPYKALANVIKGPDRRTLAILQLSHTGRQSPNAIGGRFPFAKPLAPSAIPVGTNLTLDDPIALLFHKILFQTPEEMSRMDFDLVLAAFRRGARLAQRAGFDGIELHVAHGCECRVCSYYPRFFIHRNIRPIGSVPISESGCDFSHRKCFPHPQFT